MEIDDTTNLITFSQLLIFPIGFGSILIPCSRIDKSGKSYKMLGKKIHESLHTELNENTYNFPYTI